MDLNDIKLKEIEPFFDSLGEEIELLQMTAKEVLVADFVTGVRYEEELAGIAGYRLWCGFVPNSFDVVASRFQGKGFGNQLEKQRLAYAKIHYSYIISIISDPENHQSSLYLGLKYGMKKFREKRDTVYLCISFNTRGRIICWLLPFAYPLIPYLYEVVTGRVFRAAWRKFFHRSNKQGGGSTLPG